MPPIPPTQTSVLIIGAGPIGLLIALHLTRLGHSILILDTHDKSSPTHPPYGRACMLYPRTLELLDSLSLFDALAQHGHVSWENRTLHTNGASELVSLRSGFAAGTFFDFLMNLRLQYSEEVLRGALKEAGGRVWAPARLEGYVLEEEECGDGYAVRATCVDGQGVERTIRARYIVGADGGRSTVRRIAGIPFVGERKGEGDMEYWVRIDGAVVTDLPDARRMPIQMDTEGYGKVIIVPLDHSATRVGYVLSKELFRKYGLDMSAEDAAYEAQKAVAPIKLEFTKIDWHTVYGIHQNVAERLLDRGRILLAGDAGHTHSSGSAQGMNTGVHDAVSLSWRLSGVLRGTLKDSVLQNYSDERHAIAEQLIENDKTVSELVANRKPPHLAHRPETAYELFKEFSIQQASFLLGLSISYPENLLNEVSRSIQIAVSPGHRVPDALVQKVGPSISKIRILELLRNNGNFKILVFTGDLAKTATSLRCLRHEIDTIGTAYSHLFDLATIMVGFHHAIEESLGVPSFGRAYLDIDASAHGQYGISEDKGALMIVRPDGILGLAVSFENFAEVVQYFGRFANTSDTREK